MVMSNRKAFLGVVIVWMIIGIAYFLYHYHPEILKWVIGTVGFIIANVMLFSAFKEPHDSF